MLKELAVYPFSQRNSTFVSCKVDVSHLTDTSAILELSIGCCDFPKRCLSGSMRSGIMFAKTSDVSLHGNRAERWGFTEIICCHPIKSSLVRGNDG